MELLPILTTSRQAVKSIVVSFGQLNIPQVPISLTPRSLSVVSLPPPGASFVLRFIAPGLILFISPFLARAYPAIEVSTNRTPIISARELL